MSSFMLLDPPATQSEAARTTPTQPSPPCPSSAESRRPAAAEALLPILRLEAGLAPDEVHLRLHRARRDGDVGHRTLAFYLHDMEERRLHSLLGCPSTSQYAQKRLGLGKTLAYELIGAGRALSELELLDREFCDGRLNWCQVKTLLQVVVPETQEAWIEKTRGKSLRWIEERVRATERGQPPRENGKGTPSTRFVVQARVSAEVHEVWETARRKLQDELKEPVCDAALLRHLAEGYLGKKSDEEGTNDHSPYRVIVRHCPTCRESRLQTGDGDIPLDLGTATRIACEGEIVHLETISEKSHRKAPDEDRDQGESARALVSHPAIDRPTPPALRRKILARDGYRCRHCGKRGRLHAHHLEFRSRNGPTVESNLAALCDRCHGLVHDGLLFVTGDPEDELVFRDARGEIIEVARPPLGCGALLLSLRSGRGKTFFGEDPGRASTEPDVARVDAGTPADSASAERDANSKDSARAESRSENGPEGSTAVCEERATVPPRIEDIPAVLSRRWWRKNRHFFKCTGVGRYTIAER